MNKMFELEAVVKMDGKEVPIIENIFASNATEAEEELKKKFEVEEVLSVSELSL